MITGTRYLPIIMLLILAVSIFGVSLVVNAQGEGGGPDQPHAQTSNDEDPGRIPEILIPEKYLPQRSPRAVNDELVEILYFAPQDSNNTNTLLVLYNTNVVTGTAEIHSFTMEGAEVISASLIIPPLYLLRISADTITISPLPPPSWENPAIIDFGDNSAYASLALSAGIKLEGWVAWTEEEFFNPRADGGTLPLRLSTDPPTLFLPTIERSGP